MTVRDSVRCRMPYVCDPFLALLAQLFCLRSSQSSACRRIQLVIYCTMTRKTIFWVGSSLRAFQDLPERVRLRFSHDLDRVQGGSHPSSWRPMNTVGSGVVEMRVSADGACRLLYVAKYPEGIYVLDVFLKKSRKTPMLNLEVARARLKAIL
jgi:phage-related protein